MLIIKLYNSLQFFQGNSEMRKNSLNTSDFLVTDFVIEFLRQIGVFKFEKRGEFRFKSEQLIKLIHKFTYKMQWVHISSISFHFLIFILKNLLCCKHLISVIKITLGFNNNISKILNLINNIQGKQIQQSLNTILTFDMPVYKKLSELLSKNLANKDGIHFYFLRHGQSTLNMTNSVVGWTDVELSPKGRDQSMKINKALLPHIESFTSIHTSDLKRCKETLRLSFGFTDSNNLSHKITESQNLRQLNFGDDQGVLIDSLPQDYKKLMHSLHYKAPNGQNWPSARQRAMKYLTSVSKVGHHFVSTHGGLMCALMHHLGLKEVVPNCSLISVEFCPTQKDFTKLNFEWRNPQ